jgi:spore coat protein U-like protein
MHRFLRIATKQAVEYFASIRRTGAVVAPLLWLCAVSMAQAGTTTANLTATITVTAACTINAAA